MEETKRLARWASTLAYASSTCLQEQSSLIDKVSKLMVEEGAEALVSAGAALGKGPVAQGSDAGYGRLVGGFEVFGAFQVPNSGNP